MAGGMSESALALGVAREPRSPPVKVLTTAAAIAVEQTTIPKHPAPILAPIFATDPTTTPTPAPDTAPAPAHPAQLTPRQK